MTGKGGWRLPTILEATYAAKMATMTSASPPQTIHSIERVGLFMLGLRLAPCRSGRVRQVSLLGGVRGGFMDQVSTLAKQLKAHFAIATRQSYVADFLDTLSVSIQCIARCSIAPTMERNG